MVGDQKVIVKGRFPLIKGGLAGLQPTMAGICAGGLQRKNSVRRVENPRRKRVQQEGHFFSDT